MKLYQHQEDALNKTEGFQNVAFYHDMGLGKTFTGSEAMLRFGNDVNLVICQKSKVSDWLNHFKTVYGFDEVYDLSNKRDYGSFFHSIGFYSVIGIINYDLCWRRPELLHIKDFTMMLDESSLIQNKQSKRTKFIMKLNPKNVILLSGTPCSGKYENLWTQAKLLGWDISDSLYQKQYVNWKLLELFGGRFVRIVDKANPYKNVERLKDKFREHGAVFLKTEEVMYLPEQTFIDVCVPTSKHYKKFMRDSIVTIEGEELVGDTILTKRLIARRLCGRFNEDKLKALQDIFESTNDRVIVFYSFVEELEAIRTICKKLDRSVSMVNGSVKDLEAFETENDSITIIQYQAGAMGLNLQKANIIVYFTPPERCELWMQSQKRIHRIGQNRSCFYYRMKCSGSIEEDIYRALDRGVDYTDDLFRKVVN